VTITVYSRI